MELQNMTKEDLAALYENEMTTDFPKAELKPLRAMLRLMDLGRYDPLLVTADHQFCPEKPGGRGLPDAFRRRGPPHPGDYPDGKGGGPGPKDRRPDHPGGAGGVPSHGTGGGRSLFAAL